MLIINIITIFILGLIVYQDFKYRAINCLLFFILFVVFVLSGMKNLTSIIYIRMCFANLLYLFIQMSLLAGYYCVKGESIGSILKSYIGLGDIILLITVACAFSKINFIVFYLTGLIFSLLLWHLIKNYSSQYKNHVPLAGFLSLYLILIILSNFFITSFERLNDNFLIQLIYG
jgi:hypothetical protein